MTIVPIATVYSYSCTIKFLATMHLMHAYGSCTHSYSYMHDYAYSHAIKDKPNMLKTFTHYSFQHFSKNLPIILILFSNQYLLFPYCSFALLFQVHSDVQGNKELL